jgi:hypothetical protein
MKVEDFNQEIHAALAAYERYVVCIEKTPDQFLEILRSLTAKAIKVYQNRAPGLKHGIALDGQLTIILSGLVHKSANVFWGSRRLDRRRVWSAAEFLQ